MDDLVKRLRDTHVAASRTEAADRIEADAKRIAELEEDSEILQNAAESHLVTAMRAVDRAEAAEARIAELEASRDMWRSGWYAKRSTADAAKARVRVLEDALRAGIVCTSEHGGAVKFLKIARTALGDKTDGTP